MAEHATQAVIGWGTLVQRGGLLITDPFGDVHEVVAFETPDVQADDLEATHNESPGRTKEYVRGLLDSGEASLTVNWNTTIYADHASFRADKNDGLLRYYRFILPGAMETITFRAYVKGLKRNVNANQIITADITFKVSTVTEA